MNTPVATMVQPLVGVVCTWPKVRRRGSEMKQIVTMMGMDQKDLALCPGINALVIMKVVVGGEASQEQVDGVTQVAVAAVVARFSSKSVSTESSGLNIYVPIFGF